MDQSSKKDADILHELNIFNNPHLTITSVYVDKTKTVSTSKETKTNSKRVSSNPINRPAKEVKYFSAKATTQRENNLCTISSKPNPVVSKQLKKSDVIVSGMHADASIRSKSYSEVQANDESKTTTDEIHICHCDCNCKTKHIKDKKFLKYSIHEDHLSFEEVQIKPVGIYKDNKMVYLRTDDAEIQITRSQLLETLSQVIHMQIERNLDTDELKILKQNYKRLKYPTFDCSDETKNVASTSSKLIPANQNVSSSNSNQSNQVDICKLKRQKINKVSNEIIKPQNISTQKSPSSNQFSTLKQSINKKSVKKQHTSNNQHTNTSLKHSISTVTHSQTSNKQIITGNQLHMSSKSPKIVPTSKKPVNLLPSVKSTIEYESVRGTKLCIKCRVVSETDVCTECLYPSLKNVTVTRIKLPGSSRVIAPASPTVTLKPFDSSASSLSTINPDPVDICRFGEEHEDEPCPLAPVITETATNEDLNIGKLKKGDTDKMFKVLDNIIVLSDSIDGKLFTIKLCDYILLSSGQFVNDKLIQFYLNYWYSYKLSDEDRDRSYVFDTYFYKELTSPIKPFEIDNALSPSVLRFKRLKKFTKKKNVDIFQKDFIFIPIHENNHWFMAVICFPHLLCKVDMKNGTPLQTPDGQPNSRYKQQHCDFINSERYEADPNIENLWLFDSNTTQNYFEKHGVSYAEDVANLKKKKHRLAKQPCIIIFDSLSGGVHRARVTATLRDWLKHEYSSKHNGRSMDFGPKSMVGALVKVPQQPNYTECGLFLLHYFEMFFKRPIVDYSFPIYHLENWFSVDDVSTACKKRKEINELILTRMDELNIKLPPGIKLPQLDFTSPLRTQNIPLHEKSDDESIVILDEEIDEPYDEQANVTECVWNAEDIEEEKESLRHNCDDETFNEYHHMHSNSGRIVVDVENLHSELSNHINLINNQNSHYVNYQSFRPNNHTLYRNDNDDIEDDDIKVEDIEDDDVEDNEEDYNEPNSTTYRYRHNN